MADEGKLCYKSGSGQNAGKLCYKSGSGADAGKLVWKHEARDVVVTFSWMADGMDLDICAYWEDEPSVKVGYGYNRFADTYGAAPYQIEYSGDIQSNGGTEWCKLTPPTSGDPSKTFEFVVFFNYYGYNSELYPASKCLVVASQKNGPTFTKENQPCGTDPGHPAPAYGDNYVTVTFDHNGKLTGLA